MSEVMRSGVIRMPYEMAMAGELSRRQFYNRAQSVLTELEAAEKLIEQLEDDLTMLLEERAKLGTKCDALEAIVRDLLEAFDGGFIVRDPELTSEETLAEKIHDMKKVLGDI